MCRAAPGVECKYTNIFLYENIFIKKNAPELTRAFPIKLFKMKKLTYPN
jgi:hypothetical protein